MPRPRTVDDEQILMAAARAVGEVGPGRLTLADVGSRVGLSAATLVQRFGSRRGLLLALAAHDVDAMPNRIRSAADSEGSALDALVDALVGFAASITSPAEFANHLSFLLMDLADPDFQVLSRQHAQRVTEAITDVVQAARARGEIPAQTDAGSTASLIHAVYNGALVSWGMAPNGLPAEQVAQRLGDVVALVQSSDRSVRRRGGRAPRR